MIADGVISKNSNPSWALDCEFSMDSFSEIIRFGALPRTIPSDRVIGVVHGTRLCVHLFSLLNLELHFVL